MSVWSPELSPEFPAATGTCTESVGTSRPRTEILTAQGTIVLTPAVDDGESPTADEFGSPMSPFRKGSRAWAKMTGARLGTSVSRKRKRTQVLNRDEINMVQMQARRSGAVILVDELTPRRTAVTAAAVALMCVVESTHEISDDGDDGSASMVSSALLSAASMAPSLRDRMSPRGWQRAGSALATMRAAGKWREMTARTSRDRWARIREAVRFPRSVLGGSSKTFAAEMFSLAHSQAAVCKEISPLEVTLLRRYGANIRRLQHAQIKKMQAEIGSRTRHIKHLEEQHAEMLRHSARTAGDGGVYGQSATKGQQQPQEGVETLKAQLKTNQEMLRDQRYQMQVALQRLTHGENNPALVIKTLSLKIFNVRDALKSLSEQCRAVAQCVVAESMTAADDACEMVRTLPPPAVGPKQACELAETAEGLRHSVLSFTQIFQVTGVPMGCVHNLRSFEVPQGMQPDSADSIPPYAKQLRAAQILLSEFHPCLSTLGQMWPAWYLYNKSEMSNLILSEQSLVATCDRLEAAACVALAEHRDMTERLRVAEAELAAQTKRADELEVEALKVPGLEEAAKATQVELADLTARKEAALARAASAEDQLEIIEENLELEQKKHLKTRKDLSQLDKEHSRVVSKANRLHEKCERLDIEVHELREQVGELSGALALVAEKEAGQQGQLGQETLADAIRKALREKLSVTEKQLKECRSKLAEASSTRDELRVELDDTKSLLVATQKELTARFADAIVKREATWNCFQERVGWLLSPAGQEHMSGGNPGRGGGPSQRRHDVLLSQLQEVDGGSQNTLEQTEQELSQLRIQMSQTERALNLKIAECTKLAESAEEAQKKVQRNKSRLMKYQQLLVRQKDRIVELMQRKCRVCQNVLGSPDPFAFAPQEASRTPKLEGPFAQEASRTPRLEGPAAEQPPPAPAPASDGELVVCATGSYAGGPKSPPLAGVSRESVHGYEATGRWVLLQPGQRVVGGVGDDDRDLPTSPKVKKTVQVPRAPPFPAPRCQPRENADLRMHLVSLRPQTGTRRVHVVLSDSSDDEQIEWLPSPEPPAYCLPARRLPRCVHSAPQDRVWRYAYKGAAPPKREPTVPASPRAAAVGSADKRL
eukprot:TRINITY_DN35608_c0_g1_i1.p1 TRINITY_DN35608_c0_g1~~TRINITY_DN35608_c0_g1_i1.p1  ORF type:complete len:1110 (+),score=332.74 TRINITY_DN35608_c0_g1_i1:49-3378(+)